MKAFLRPLLASTFVGAVLFASATDAKAAGHANGFGEKGELIITGDRLVPLFGYTHSSVERDGQINITEIRETSSNRSGISLLFGRDLSGSEDGVGEFSQPVNMHSLPRVAFDFTIIPHLTLGAALAFGFGLGGSTSEERSTGPNSSVTVKVDAPTYTAIGLAPRVGYIIPLGEHLALWPRGGFSFYSLSAKVETSVANAPREISVTDTLFALDLDAQLAIIPVEHFLITVGPMLNIPVSGNRSISTTAGANTTTIDRDISVLHFGIHAGIGGWVNLF
ncbi:MAG: hypothetical protein KIT84_29680 [Labilithrix sp.]|nr:hypothetical protein [Labilithrix sp.]MCW5815234.1 hypothetical protein [Labilithrix sp.]